MITTLNVVSQGITQMNAQTRRKENAKEKENNISSTIKILAMITTLKVKLKRKMKLYK